MNKTVLDIVVIVAALIAGGIVSVLDNPLTATFVFIVVLGSWEFTKFLPSVLGNKRESA